MAAAVDRLDGWGSGPGLLALNGWSMEMAVPESGRWERQEQGGQLQLSISAWYQPRGEGGPGVRASHPVTSVYWGLAARHQCIFYALD